MQLRLDESLEGEIAAIRITSVRWRSSEIGPHMPCIRYADLQMAISIRWCNIRILRGIPVWLCELFAGCARRWKLSFGDFTPLRV